MALKKVTFLVPDMASPILGAVSAMAGALTRHFSVEVVGPDVGHGVCGMYRDSFPYIVVPAPRIYRFPEYLAGVSALSRRITGDVVVTVKAYADTLPLGYWHKKRHGRPWVVYLDEWDGAVLAGLRPWTRVCRMAKHLHHPLDDEYFPWMERLIPRADLVVSSSTALQRQFGGVVIPLGVDTESFDPAKIKGTDQLRNELGLTGKKVIVFGGVVRPHKGIDCLLQALTYLGDAGVQLLVVGPETDYLRALMQDSVWKPFLRCAGAQPKAKMPDYLALADLVALPQQDTALARTQVPCKVFEAMAMAKPILASRMSDLPDILNDCGWLASPGDVSAWADAIAHILAHAGEAGEKGNRARAKCLQHYNVKVMETMWKTALDNLTSETGV